MVILRKLATGPSRGLVLHNGGDSLYSSREKGGDSFRKVIFCLTGPYLTRRATIGRLEPPLGRGRFVWHPPTSLPTSHPHKYNGLYGPGFISVMTPGDPLPQPNCVIDLFFCGISSTAYPPPLPSSRLIEPPLSVGEVREVVDASTMGRICQCVSRPAPGWGGVAP